MIISWVPGVKSTSYLYVTTIFNDTTGGTASGTNGGGATPGTPTYNLAGQIVETVGGTQGVLASRSVVKVG